MAKQSTWDLFQRNARGTFWGGIELASVFASGGNYAAPFVFIAHIFLLPITLTFGAGIKTIADSWFRKPLEDAELSLLKPIITRLEETEVNDICGSLKNFLSPLCLVSGACYNC